MKKKSILALLCLLAMLLCVGCNSATNKGFFLYKSSPIGFRMEYPSSWQKQVDLDKHIAAFVTPTEGLGDAYRDNLTVSYEERGERSFDEFFEEYYGSLPATFAGFTEESREQVVLAGKEAHKIVFSSHTETTEEDGTKKEVMLRFQQYIVDREERVYFITFIATPDSYKYFGPYVTTMLDTLSFSV